MNSILTILTDPLVDLTVRISLLALFVFALVPKLGSAADFRERVRDYRLVPDRWSGVVAHVLIALEAAAAAGLLLDFAPLILLGAILLSVYALAMLANLLRGRSDLDCGCGGPAARRTISGTLVARNLVLAGLALWCLQPSLRPRELSSLDAFTAVSAVASVVLLVLAAGRLSRHPASGRRG